MPDMPAIIHFQGKHHTTSFGIWVGFQPSSLLFRSKYRSTLSFPWVGPKRFHPSPVSAEELPDIDIVLITHDHYDHLEKSTIVTINKNIGERLGPFDVTFLKIGAYSDKGTWRLLHMTPEEAGQQHLDLRGQLLIPLHWATFDMALHPWYEPIERLVTFSEQESITLITPEVGKMINLRDNSNIDHWWLKYKKK